MDTEEPKTSALQLSTESHTSQTSPNDDDILALQEAVSGNTSSISELESDKQDNLTAGTGIILDVNNIISAEFPDGKYLNTFYVNDNEVGIKGYIQQTLDLMAQQQGVVLKISAGSYGIEERARRVDAFDKELVYNYIHGIETPTPSNNVCVDFCPLVEIDKGKRDE